MRSFVRTGSPVCATADMVLSLKIEGINLLVFNILHCSAFVLTV